VRDLLVLCQKALFHNHISAQNILFRRPVVSIRAWLIQCSVVFIKTKSRFKSFVTIDKQKVFKSRAPATCPPPPPPPSPQLRQSLAILYLPFKCNPHDLPVCARHLASSCNRARSCASPSSSYTSETFPAR
jgi:hypothetical protein